MKHFAIVLVVGVVACQDQGSGADGAIMDAGFSADATTDASIRVDASPPADASGDDHDLSCVGAPPPTTAAASVELALSVFDATTNPITTLAAVTIEVRRTSDDVVLAQTTSDANGGALLSVDTTGVPIVAYVVLTKPGFVPTRFVPVHGLYRDQALPLALVTASGLDAWYAQAAQTPQDGRATVIGFNQDCAGDGLEGTTLQLPGASSIVYWNDAIQQWDPSLGTASNSWALATNVPPGPVTIGSSWQGTILGSHTVDVRAGELTFVVVEPR